MRNFVLSAILAVAMNLPAQHLFAQLRGDLHITGEVRHDPSVRVNDLWVELHDRQQPQAIERVPVMNDGSFEMRNVVPGNYEVRLVSAYGEALRSEYVSLNQGRPSVAFQINRPAQKPVSGAVAISQLEHNVNRKALREYRLAAKAFANGDQAASVPHLERAIEADPQFAPAHLQLGVALSAEGKPEQALVEFQKATALDPALALGHLNLAIVLMKFDRFGEAEAEVRRVIQLDSNIMKAHFLLAVSLLRQQKHAREALNHLRLAYGEFPQARVMGEKLEVQLAAYQSK